MYALINYIKNLFYKQPDTFNAKAKDIKDNHSIKLIITGDINTQQIFCEIETKICDLLENNSATERCEQLAFFLYLLCNNNKHVTSLILDNIELQKKRSAQHSLFYENILYFLKHYLVMKHNISLDISEPLIKPTRAFVNNIS